MENQIFKVIVVTLLSVRNICCKHYSCDIIKSMENYIFKVIVVTLLRVWKIIPLKL